MHCLQVGRIIHGLLLSVLLFPVSAVFAAPAEKPASKTRGSAVVFLDSDYVEVAVSANGNFTLGTRTGDPAISTDDNRLLLYGHPNPATGATTLRIDGNDFWNYQEAMLGTLVSGPTAGGLSSTTVWQSSGVELTQKLSIVATNSTGRADTLLIEFVATNNDTVSHDVGIRQLLDTQLGNNDGAPFQVSGIGNVTRETEAIAPAVPQSFLVYDNLARPSITASGVLIGDHAITPDRVVFGDWRKMHNYAWDYAINPLDGLTSDSAVFFYWSPLPLSPGASRYAAVYYGVGHLDADTEPPLVVALDDPGELTVLWGNYAPNPFTITCLMQNSLLARTLNDVYAEIDLPRGLVLAAGETTRKEVGTLQNGASSSVSWEVIAAYQEQDASLPYDVTVGAEGQNSKTVSHTIQVPRLPCPDTAGLANGYQADFSSGANCWSRVTAPAVFDEPQLTEEEDALRLNANGSADAFGFWHSPGLLVHGGDLLTVEWRVRGSGPALSAPKIRFRVNDRSLRWASTETTESFSTADGSPDTEPRVYTQRVFLPEYVSEIELAFDLLSFWPEDDLNFSVDLMSVRVAATAVTAP